MHGSLITYSTAKTETILSMYHIWSVLSLWYQNRSWVLPGNKDLVLYQQFSTSVSMQPSIWLFCWFEQMQKIYFVDFYLTTLSRYKYIELGYGALWNKRHFLHHIIFFISKSKPIRTGQHDLKISLETKLHIYFILFYYYSKWGSCVSCWL